MTKQTGLPAIIAPRLLDRAASAAYISVSPNTFDRMVIEDRMPKPKILSGRRIAWDIRELDKAVSALPIYGGQDDDSTWAINAA